MPILNRLPEDAAVALKADDARACDRVSLD
jgi:hypothetical protein